MKIKIRHTKVFTQTYKAIDDGVRNIIQEGSSRSSKTWSDFQALYKYGNKYPKTRIVVLRDTAVDCADIVEADFERWASDPCGRNDQFNDGEITLDELEAYLEYEDLSQYFERNRTKHIWKFPNGSTLRFTGIDKISKAMGMTQDVVWLNEPYLFSEKIYNQIAQRTSRFILIDWNPMQDHWIENVKMLDNARVLKSTFLDNPFCPEESRNKILSYQQPHQSEVVESGLISVQNARKYDLALNDLSFTESQLEELRRTLYNESKSKHTEDDAWHWVVFGLGEKAERPNRIFKWNPIALHDYYAIDSHVYYACDWGTVDPWAIVEVKYHDGNLYVHELNYDSEEIIEKNLTSIDRQQMNSQGGIIPYIFNKVNVRKDRPVVVDSNEGYRAKIELLQSYGWQYVVGAKKPPGSIKEGISLLRKLNVFYTATSKNAERESELYSWEVDRMGNKTGEPEDKNNHIIDDVRYKASFLRDQGIIKIV